MDTQVSPSWESCLQQNKLQLTEEVRSTPCPHAQARPLPTTVSHGGTQGWLPWASESLSQALLSGDLS